jgi:hypothetical protein
MHTHAKKFLSVSLSLTHEHTHTHTHTTSSNSDSSSSTVRVNSSSQTGLQVRSLTNVEHIFEPILCDIHAIQNAGRSIFLRKGLALSCVCMSASVCVCEDLHDAYRDEEVDSRRGALCMMLRLVNLHSHSQPIHVSQSTMSQ